MPPIELELVLTHTQALLAAAPVPDPKRKTERTVLTGDVPSPIHPPPGCRFHTRCPYTQDICKTEKPLLLDMGRNHFAACHFVVSLSLKPSGF